MPAPTLHLLDTTHYPVITLDDTRLAPGDGLRILQDLDTLIQHGDAFALILDNGDEAETRDPDEDKARMRWLIGNRQRLATVCKGIVSVVPDPHRRPQVEKQAAGLRQALGVQFLAVGYAAEALAVAQRLLQKG